MNAHLRLDGRVVIVTGAGRGIGRAYAELLASRGAKVVVNDRPPASRQHQSETTQAIRAAGGIAHDALADISDRPGADSVIAIALERFGRIDALVNNAGTFSEAKAFEDATLLDFTSLWAANMATTLHTTQAAWPHLLASPAGRLVNTVSTAGIYGCGTHLAYSSAKGAVLSFTTALAAASTGSVQVNAVAPGGFTPMIESGFPSEPQRSAVQRALRPELAAPLVNWLVHPSCDAHGQVFESMAGRVARVFTGEPDGYWDRDMTPESLAKNWASVDDPDGVQYRGGFADWIRWQVGRSSVVQERKSTPE